MPTLFLRIIDIVLSTLGIICLSPVFIIVTLLGILDTGAPLFYQKRVGKNKKQFTLIKFRTMSTDTKPLGTHLVNTAAITKLGHILRRSKLDELPQLINVLLGDMSLVGYRPCLPSQHLLIKERETRRIFDSKPGITGLAQVNIIDMSTPRKLARYDSLMARHLSLALYIKLIFATLVGNGRGDRVSRT